MKHCGKVAEFDPSQAMKEITDNVRDAWNQCGVRAPFAETANIWLRYGDDPATMDDQHFPVWYPAWKQLPALEPILHQIMGLFEPYHVGGILLTRMPRGSRIHPHTDTGQWHSEFYSTTVYAVLKSNDQCFSYYENEKVAMRTGEIWWANDLVKNWTHNDGDTSRVVMTVSLRCE